MVSKVCNLGMSIALFTLSIHLSIYPYFLGCSQKRSIILSDVQNKSNLTNELSQSNQFLNKQITFHQRIIDLLSLNIDASQDLSKLMNVSKSVLEDVSGCTLEQIGVFDRLVFRHISLYKLFSNVTFSNLFTSLTTYLPF